MIGQSISADINFARTRSSRVDKVPVYLFDKTVETIAAETPSVLATTFCDLPSQATAKTCTQSGRALPQAS